jgi:hypothetical protein
VYKAVSRTGKWKSRFNPALLLDSVLEENGDAQRAIRLVGPWRPDSQRGLDSVSVWVGPRQISRSLVLSCVSGLLAGGTIGQSATGAQMESGDSAQPIQLKRSRPIRLAKNRITS